MRPATLAELAARHDVALPAIRGYADFPAFSAMYRSACTVIQAPDDLRRLVDEIVEDAALAGAAWVEPAFYAPFHEEMMGTAEAVIELVLEAGAGAADRTGVGVGFMLAANRSADPEDACRQAKLAARYAAEGIVSFGLANDESIFPPAPFAEAYDTARGAGLLATPHAGELAGPESVIGALEHLGADRIQHGIRAVEDPALVARLAEEGTCLDVCPTSNLMLAVVPSLAEHPLADLLDAGVRCSVNADDSLLFGCGLLDEYELCRTAFGFDDQRMASIARSSIEASGATAERKRVAVAGIDRWLAAAPTTEQPPARRGGAG